MEVRVSLFLKTQGSPQWLQNLSSCLLVPVCHTQLLLDFLGMTPPLNQPQSLSPLWFFLLHFPGNKHHLTNCSNSEAKSLFSSFSLSIPSPSQSVLLLLSVIMTPTRLMSGSPWLCLLSSLTLLGSRSTFLQPSVLTPSLCLKPSGSPLPHTCRSLVFWPWTNHLTSVTLIFVWVKWGSQSFYDFSAALWRLSSSHIC